MKLHRLGLLVSVVLTALSLMILFEGEPYGVALRIDASASSLNATEPSRSKHQAGLVAMFEADQAWSVEDLQFLISLARRLQVSAGVTRVETPVTAQIPQLHNDDIELASLDQRLSAYPEKAQHWVDLIFAEPLLRGRLIGNRGELAFSIRIAANSAPELDQLANDIRELVVNAMAERPDLRVTVTGAPLVTSAIGAQIFDDLKVVMLLAALLCAVLLVASFGHPLAAILPLLTIAAAMLWTLASMALLDLPINLVTAIVPPLVMTLTLAYAMHALFAICAADDREHAIKELLVPLTVTGITTIAGLLALCLQTTPAVRQFGVAGTLGVIAGVVAVMSILCPALLFWGKGITPRPGLHRLLDPVARRLAIFAIRKRRRVIFMGACVLVLGVLGGSQITTGVRLISDMSLDHPARQAYQHVTDRLGGANGFDIVLSAGTIDGVLLPDVLNGVEGLQEWLNGRSDVAGSQSLVDILKRLNQIFSDDPRQNYQLPAGLGLAKQLLMIAAPPETSDYTDLNYTELTVRVRTRLDDTAELSKLFDATRIRLKQLPPGLKVELRGNAVDLVDTIKQLTSGQLMSLSLAMLAIFIVLAVLFSSFTMGLRALLPNLLPVAVYFGLIGFIGIPLGPTTALVAGIVLGVAVDDTLFYLVHFNRNARVLANERRATQAAMREVIHPVSVTTVAVVAGFCCLSVSSFESQVAFGLLAASTLLFAWLFDLTLTPALSARSSIVTLWDVLRLDLGQDPENSIPMLKGLSPRQARIFALLTEIRKIPQDADLIRRGDAASDMFIVIEGELKVWIEGGQELDRVNRGDTVGETGLFHGKRTANVTALQDCRLLVLNLAALERVEKRYPRIAARVLHNLNRIQAEHLNSVNKLILPNIAQESV